MSLYGTLEGLRVARFHRAFRVTVTPPFNMDTFSAFVHNKGRGDERGVKKNSAPLRGTFFTYNTTKNQICKIHVQERGRGEQRKRAGEEGVNEG